MSNLSELLPAGGAAKEFEPVASGTLPNGQAVALKTDGTVETISGVSQSVTAASTFSSTDARAGVDSAVYDTASNRVVIAYRDQGNSSYGTAVVGTVSGSSITFGSPVVFNSGATYSVTAAYDSSSNKTVIAFQNGSNNYGIAYVGTVSGTSISFGTSVTFNTSTSDVGICYDVASNKTVISYRDTGNSNHGTALVGTVSGTSISFGSEVVFNAADVTDTTPVYDSINQKSVIVYRDNGNASYGTAIVGTVSGTSISFGTEAVFNSTTTADPRPVYDSVNQKVVISYINQGNSSYGTTVVGTVSGTGISYGTPVVVNSNSTSRLASTYNTAAGGVVVAYRDGSNVAKVITGNVSGTSISFGSAVVFDTATDVTYVTATYDPDIGKSIIVYETSNRGETVLYTSPSSNNTSFVGITAEAITSGATGVVVPQGGVAASVANTPLLQVYGSETIWTTNNGYYPEIAYDPNNADKFVIGYIDASDSTKGKVVVGTISGTSVSYGTPYEYYNTNSELPSISWDPNTANKFVVVFSDQNTSDGKAVVGTVSGTSISYGTVVDFNGTDSTIYPKIDFDPSTAGSFVICFKDQQNSQYGVAIVGTMSGTSLSFGTKSVFASARSDDIRIAFDPTTANKCVICYKDQPNSSYGTAVVGTVSGTGISFGTEVVFNTGSTNYLSIAFDPNTANKCVIGYTDSGNSSYGTAVVGTVSGTSISFSSEYVFNTGSTNTITVSFDPNTPNRILVSYTDYGNSSYGTAVLGTVSGTSLSFGSENVFNSGSAGGAAMSFDPSTANKYVVATNVSTSRVGTLSDALTIASNYYVQSDGSVSTVSTSPAVHIGKAISATSLILKG